MEPGSQLMMELLQALGPMGFIFWLVHRTTTHTVPRLAKSFEEGIDKQRIDFKELAKQQHESFERMLIRQQDKTDQILTELRKLNDHE